MSSSKLMSLDRLERAERGYWEKQFKGMRSYWDIPGMKAGVVTGKVAWDLLEYCQVRELALPALDCTSPRTCDLLLTEAAKMELPAYLRFSVRSASRFAGKMELPIGEGKYEAAILGACAGAHHVRYVAATYGIPVIVHSDYCSAELLPWFDGMLEADEAFYEEHGETLFTSHSLDLCLKLEENVIVSKYLDKIRNDQILEIANDHVRLRLLTDHEMDYEQIFRRLGDA
jgi:fructose/tagatose bisphosphate aldolase